MTKTVDIASEVVAEFRQGNADVGTSIAALLTSLPAEVHKGVMLRAPGAGDPAPNTAVVYVGGAKVTADANNETGGWPLAPGDSVTLPLADATKLFTVSGTASQKLAYWIM